MLDEQCPKHEFQDDILLLNCQTVAMDLILIFKFKVIIVHDREDSSVFVNLFIYLFIFKLYQALLLVLLFVWLWALRFLTRLDFKGPLSRNQC